MPCPHNPSSPLEYPARHTAGRKLNINLSETPAVSPPPLFNVDCCLGDTRLNHKESPEIMQELADAIGITCANIIAFDPDDLSVREKLRLASTRYATEEEDVAYSLIFKSDIIPHYGERDAALGHLFEEIMARSREVTVLDWTGEPSPYNSCLPATLAVYNHRLVLHLSNPCPFRQPSTTPPLHHLHRCNLTSIARRCKFRTSDRLSLKEPRKFIFTHPWI